MANSIVQQNNSGSPFDSIRHHDENGNEYWLARELQKILGYAKWQRFEDAIDRAKASLLNQGLDITTHITASGKLDTLATLATPKTSGDYKLSRHACYTIAMNGDPRKDEIAQAQGYFVLKSRQAEVSDVISKSELQAAKNEVARLQKAKAIEQLGKKRKKEYLKAEFIREASKDLAIDLMVLVHGQEYDTSSPIVNRINQWCVNNSAQAFKHFGIVFHSELFDSNGCPRNTPIANVNKLLRIIGFTPKVSRQIGSKANRIYIYRAGKLSRSALSIGGAK
jgi:hypothetical protein